MRISWLMGLTHPPEHRGCNLQLRFWVPSWKCFMLPLHLPAGGRGAAPPARALSELCQRKLPRRSSDLVQLAPSSAPFPALTSCLATSNSCAWRPIRCPEEWGCAPLPFLKGSFPASRDVWDSRKWDAFCSSYKLLAFSISRKKRDPTGSHTSAES